MNDFQQTIMSDRLTLVDFYATWCGPCKMMHPIIDQLEKELGNQIQVVKVDVDQDMTLSTQYSVLSVPTLMLFRNGQSLWRHTGTLPLSELKRIIHEHQ